VDIVKKLNQLGNLLLNILFVKKDNIFQKYVSFLLFCILDWSKYIQIGAYDCASESISNTDICQDEKYPQWRIYCPLTNSTQLAFHTSKRTAEDILKNSLEKLNEIADECYGKSWPIQKVIQPNTKDDLNRIIPKHIKQFQLFISDDNLQYTLVKYIYFFIYLLKRNII